MECQYLKIEDNTSYHGDVYDHPVYKYTCLKSGREIIPIVCNRCKNKKENNHGNFKKIWSEDEE